MTVIQAEDVEIEIRDGNWRVYPSGSDMPAHEPLFKVTRGSGIMEYLSEFADARGLPGTVLSIEYVRAVVLGYENKSQRWLLGLHIAREEKDKPRWLELVRWPPGNNAIYAEAAQQVARPLAEYIGCPLKIFGAKKLPPARPPGMARSGITGPLSPHKREDIGPQRVRLFAQSVTLPVQYPGIWLGKGKGGVILRLAKDLTAQKRGTVAPSFNQCVIDPDHGTIRLQPPTGLLGGFFGGQQGREIRTDEVHNVEVRLTITHEHTTQPEGDNLATEVTHIHYLWEVYLTLADESLLLMQTTHATSSELSRKRATVGDKFSINSKAGIEYLRQHREDQDAYEAAETFARTAAIVIASTLGVHVVKTQVEDEFA